MFNETAPAQPDAITAGANLAPVPDHVPGHLIYDFDMYNPGDLSAISSQQAWAKLQAPGVPDLVWSRCNGGHWIATRAQLIRDAYADTARFSARCAILPREAAEINDFLPNTMDPPEHRPFRAMISRAVGLPLVDRMEEKVRELSISLIEDLRLKGQCNFTTDYAEPFPIRIFMLIAGLPESDIPRLKFLADQLTRPDGQMTFIEAKTAMFDYMEPIIEKCRREPNDGVISQVANSDINGRPITVDEAKRVAALLLVAGLDTVVNFLSFCMEFMAKSPEHRKELRDNPEKIPAATEELLRRFSLVANARILTTDHEFNGVQLKEGDMILLPQMLAGLDERENACPMHVDFNREKVAHNTFGHGVHLCVGQHLARREIMITLREWLARIPEFSIAPGAKIEHASGVVSAVKSLPLVWDPATTKAI